MRRSPQASGGPGCKGSKIWAVWAVWALMILCIDALVGLPQMGSETEDISERDPTTECVDTNAHFGKGVYPFGNDLHNGEPIRLAVTLPVTSRGHGSRHVSQMRFFTSFLHSFIDTAIPTEFPITFEFYVGYDKGDPILDSQDGRTLFQAEFHRLLKDIHAEALCGGGPCFSIKFMGFNTTNTLTALWNGLNVQAYTDGCHYMFMPNDDLRMISKGWPGRFVKALSMSPMVANLGVTGPVDPVSGRGDMSSMPMVHRLHLEIFEGVSLPESFQNWYNDVWLGNVYRPFGANLMARDVLSKNHDGCEDPLHCSRYELGQGAVAPWVRETGKGRMAVAKWLLNKGIPVQSVDALINERITIGD